MEEMKLDSKAKVTAPEKLDADQNTFLGVQVSVALPEASHVSLTLLDSAESVVVAATADDDSTAAPTSGTGRASFQRMAHHVGKSAKILQLMGDSAAVPTLSFQDPASSAPPEDVAATPTDPPSPTAAVRRGKSTKVMQLMGESQAVKIWGSVNRHRLEAQQALSRRGAAQSQATATFFGMVG